MDESGKTTYYTTAKGVRKRRVEILIREDLAKILFAKAIEEYGKGRGGVSALIERLLEEHFSTNPGDPGESRVEKVFNNILIEIAKMRNTRVDMINEVTEQEIMRAVSNLRGTDNRTIRKWLNILIDQGYLQIIAGSPPKRVFRIRKKITTE
ncbi:MAG: hypothetical protein QW607_09640 [Desulfurococcaceae archaeon]